MMRLQNYYAAIEEFKIAISLNPNSQASAAYYYNLGAVYSKLGAYKLAYPCYQRALKLNPNFNYYYKNVSKKPKNKKLK